MSTSLAGYINFKRASRHYNVSRSTLDRRRDKAREDDDPTIYAYFVVQTRLGEVIRTPSKEKVDQLIKSGEAPQWYVSKAWLEKEYGRRDAQPGQGSGEPHQPRDSETLAALQDSYEARITDLKEQLAAAHIEKKELMHYAQADKQLLAKATEGLTQVLALPGIAEAAKAQRGELVIGVTHEAPTGKSQPHEPSRGDKQHSQEAARPAPESAQGPKSKRRLWNWLAKRSA